MESIPPQIKYTYSDDERLDMLIHSIKGNHECSQERKTFNLCRANLIGKYVDPNFCFPDASNLIDCFNKVRKDERPDCKAKYQKVFECSKTNVSSWLSVGGCQKDLNEYLAC